MSNRWPPDVEIIRDYGTDVCGRDFKSKTIDDMHKLFLEDEVGFYDVVLISSRAYEKGLLPKKKALLSKEQFELIRRNMKNEKK